MGLRRKQLHLRLRGNVYYFRMAIPKFLVPILGVEEYKKSLKTGDVRVARMMGRDLSNRMEAFIMMVKAMKPTDEHLRTLVRCYFESILAEGEQTLTFETITSRSDYIDDYDPDAILTSTEIASRRVQTLEPLKTGHRYTPRQENTAKRLLEKHGYDLSNNSERYHRLCLDLVRADFEGERIKLAYFSGKPQDGQIQDPFFRDCHHYFEEPDPEYFLRKENENIVNIPKTLTEGIDAFLEDRLLKREKYKTSEKQVRETRRKLERLIDIFGANRPLADVTAHYGQTIEDIVYKIPANYVQKFKNKGISFRDALESDAAKLDIATKTDYLINFKMLFKWLNSKGYVRIDPMADIDLPAKKRARRGELRRPFATEELKTFIHSPMMTSRQNEKRELWKPGTLQIRDGNFWVPLIGLFTGMRLGEILYLLPKDIKQDNGVWYIDVNKDEEGKELKNEQSKRKIPIHPMLIKIGLIEYVQRRAKLCGKTGKRLFEDNITLPQNQKVIKNQSRNFGTYLKKIGLKTDTKLVFHSFRHNFVDKIRRIPAITTEIMDALDGREAGTEKTQSTRNQYGSDLEPSFLYDWVKQIDYGIDLSHLHPKDE